MNRDRQVADALELRRGAYTGGVDFRHRFGGERFEVSGYALGSYVTGSARRHRRRAALLRALLPAARRRLPRTTTRRARALDGASAFFAFAKIGGGSWRYSTGLLTRSPGFEVNDIGYQRDADNTMTWIWVGYQQTTPRGPVPALQPQRERMERLELRRAIAPGSAATSTAASSSRTSGTGTPAVNRDLSAYSGRTLRGGPLFRRERVDQLLGGPGLGLAQGRLPRTQHLGRRPLRERLVEPGLLAERALPALRTRHLQRRRVGEPERGRLPVDRRIRRRRGPVRLRPHRPDHGRADGARGLRLHARRSRCRSMRSPS